MGLIFKKIDGSFITGDFIEETPVISSNTLAPDIIATDEASPGTCALIENANLDTIKIKSSNFTITLDGTITQFCQMQDIAEKIIGFEQQVIDVESDITIINLLLGQLIKLNLKQDTAILFDNVPQGAMSIITLIVEHLEDDLQLIIEDAHHENGETPLFSSVKNAIDIILIWYEGGTTLNIRNIMRNYQSISSLEDSNHGTVSYNSNYVNYRKPDTKDTSELLPNSLVCCNDDLGNFKFTNIIVTPDGIWGPHSQLLCRYKLMLLKQQIVVAKPNTIIDYKFGTVVILNHNDDITLLSFINIPDNQTAKFFIKRIKDNSDIPRDISFNYPYLYSGIPNLTQEPNAVDWIIVDCTLKPKPLNRLNIFNNFKKPPKGKRTGTPVALSLGVNSRGFRYCIPYTVSDELSYVLVYEASSETVVTTVYISLYKLDHLTTEFTKLFDVKNLSNQMLDLTPNGTFGVHFNKRYFYYSMGTSFFIADLDNGSQWFTFSSTFTTVHSRASHTPDGSRIVHWQTYNNSDAAPKHVDYIVNTSNKTATILTHTLSNAIVGRNYGNLEWLRDLGIFRATAFISGPAQPVFYNITPGSPALRDTLPTAGLTSLHTAIRTNFDTGEIFATHTKNSDLIKYDLPYWSTYHANVDLGEATSPSSTAFTYAAQDGIVVLWGFADPMKIWISYKEIGDDMYFKHVCNVRDLVPGMLSHGGQNLAMPMNAISKAGFLLGGYLKGTTTATPLIWCPFLYD